MVNQDEREDRDGTLFDIGIVGGGPAGLSAALWSARYGHSVVLIDSGDPRNWETRGVNGYLGLPGIRPPELRGRGRDELRGYGVRLIDATVLRVEPDESARPATTEPEPDSDSVFCFHLEGGESVSARRVLLAIGMRDVWPDIPGLAQAYGANAHVCPDCDGYDTRGKKVVVIGHGRRAVAMALALTTWSDDIVIATHGHAPDFGDEELEKLAANAIGIVSEEIACVECKGHDIASLVLANGERLDTDKVFFNFAQYPADDLGAQLGCERDRGGHIVVSDHHATSVTSVFAAGDITPGAQLAIRGAAGGAVAAMAMHKSLVPAHRKLRDLSR